jgi:hypothetical protein
MDLESENQLCRRKTKTKTKEHPCMFATIFGADVDE